MSRTGWKPVHGARQLGIPIPASCPHDVAWNVSSWRVLGHPPYYTMSRFRSYGCPLRRRTAQVTTLPCVGTEKMNKFTCLVMLKCNLIVPRIGWYGLYTILWVSFHRHNGQPVVQQSLPYRGNKSSRDLNLNPSMLSSVLANIMSSSSMWQPCRCSFVLGCLHP